MTQAMRLQTLEPDFDAHSPPAQCWAPTQPLPLGELVGTIAPGGHRLGRDGELKLLREPARPGAARLIRKLLAAQSARECEHHVRTALQACGFDGYAYFTLEPDEAGLRPRELRDTFANRAWLRRYFAERYHEVDPRLAQVAGSRLPVPWSCSELEARWPQALEPDSRLQRMLADLRACGIGSGVMFNVAWPAGGAGRTVVSLTSARPDRQWINGSVLGRALAFGLNMHEFHAHHDHHARPHGGLAPEELEQLRARLTPLQQAVLAGFEQGMDDAQVAQWLGISTYAVDYHRRQLQWRFDTRGPAAQVANAR
jgi:DNA-binding CsgD family transcriptional regulator